MRPVESGGTASQPQAGSEPGRLTRRASVHSAIGFTTRRVCVFLPAKIARTIEPENRIGRSRTAHLRVLPHAKILGPLARVSPLAIGEVQAAHVPDRPVT